MEIFKDAPVQKLQYDLEKIQFKYPFFEYFVLLQF